MKRLFHWLTRPWLLALFGVLALSAIVWFEGPLLAFDGNEPLASSSRRWTIIVILLALWAGYFLWRFISARIANARLMKSVGGADQPAPSAESQQTSAEVATLNQRFQDAMAILRKSSASSSGRFSWLGGQYLYQIPWYMFVGAPGSGKTTALVHSGLRFPLSDALGKEAIRGVGGTRNCDWWFTDEAVLLDTAGRYTTQDSHSAVDKAAWSGFLDLLKKNRKRRPINGVIVAVSVADLLRQSDAERRTQALAIRERIKELHERLEIRFPIYVLITKCDLLAGFVEYFESLGKDERMQVWGVTFPVVDAEKIDQTLTAFPAEFKALEARLQQRVLDRVQQERDVRRRALVYGFPQQFSSIGDVLNTFLSDVFQSTRFEERALLRGVYFTSGTQEGSPIDRVMGALAASFGLTRQALPPHAIGGRSYFITRLLRDVMFEESGLAGANLKLEKKRLWLQRAAWIATAVVLVLITAALLTSYWRNQAYVSTVASRVAEIDQAAGNLPQQAPVQSLLPLLNAVRDIPAGYGERDRGVPLLSGLGLYQGDKLGSEAQALYQRLLRETLLPRVIGRIEDQLRRGAANSPEYLYETLRVYLMLGEKKHFEADSVNAWADYDWERNLGRETTDEQRRELSAHLGAVLERLHDNGPIEIDKDLIAQTRQALARVPLPQRVVARLNREMTRAKLNEFTINAAAGRDAALVFTRRSGEPLTRGVPGLYTQAGYQQFVERADLAIAGVLKDNWVLGREESVDLAAIGQLKAAVQQLYFDDFIKQWDALLGDISIAPFGGLDQGARIVSSLAGAESPLRKFIVAASKETTFTGVKTDSTLGGAVKDRLDGVKKQLKSALASIDDAPPAPAVTAQIHPVDAHFDALHKLVATVGGGPAPLDQTLAMLNEVSAFLDAADSARRQGAPAPASDALPKLRREAEGKPAPLGPMLQTIANNGSALTLGSERARLNSMWTANVASFCRQAISGRYPMARKSTQEITQDDFGRVFAPGGMIDDFVQKNLLAYIDMSGAQWRWRPFGNVSLGIPQSVLTELQRAALIRDAFFGAGGKTPSIRFELKPVMMDASVTQFMLDIDGQVLSYSHGPIRPSAFQWPSGKVSSQARVEFSPPSNTGRNGFAADGPWAWFKLIDKGALEPTGQKERFNLTFALDGRKIVLELSASSVLNPFKLDALEQFRCPERL